MKEKTFFIVCMLIGIVLLGYGLGMQSVGHYLGQTEGNAALPTILGAIMFITSFFIVLTDGVKIEGEGE